jgi:hypothetical protein
LRAKNATIRDLKCLLAVREESSVGKREGDDMAVSKSLREAVEELLASKNYNLRPRKVD